MLLFTLEFIFDLSDFILSSVNYCRSLQFKILHRSSYTFTSVIRPTVVFPLRNKSLLPLKRRFVVGGNAEHSCEYHGFCAVEFAE